MLAVCLGSVQLRVPAVSLPPPRPLGSPGPKAFSLAEPQRDEDPPGQVGAAGRRLAGREEPRAVWNPERRGDSKPGTADGDGNIETRALI